MLGRFHAAGGLLALASALSGCSAEDVHLSLGLEGRSAIVVTRGPDLLEVEAVQSMPLRRAHPAGGALDVYVLRYDAPLEALGLTEGPMVTTEAPGEGLPLPPTSDLRRHAFVDGVLESEVALDVWPPAITEVELPPVDVRACVAGGGCLRARPGDLALVCKSDCGTPAAPTPPRPPALPQLTPCPSGWSERAPEGPHEVVECLPWTQVRTCGVGLAQRPGSDVCTPVGHECPSSGRWSTRMVPGSTTYYVDLEAAAGGDGSAAQPFSALADVPSTTTGTVVVYLGPGRFTAPSEAWSSPVVLVGACPQRTSFGSARFSEGQVTLTDMTLQRLEVFGANLQLDGVVVDTSDSRAVTVDSGRLRAEDVRFVGGSFAALVVRGDAQADVRRASVEGGDVVSYGQLRIEDSAVRDADFGVRSDDGGAADVERVSILDTRVACLRTESAQSRLTIEDVRCEAQLLTRSARVLSFDGARLEAERLVVRGGESYGLRIDGASADLSQVVVRDTKPNPIEQRFGAGIELSNGADVDARGVLLLRSQGFGLLGADPSTEGRFEDLSVIDVVGWQIDGEQGAGIELKDNAALDLRRAQIRESRGMGLLMESEARLDGSDLLIEDVLARDANGAYGRGMEIDQRAQLGLSRVAVRRAKNIGVHILNGAVAKLTDLTVQDTARSDCYMFSCNAGIADGIISTLGGDLEVSRFLVEGNGEIGVRVINQSVLWLREGRIRDHPVGAQVITEGYDLRLLAEGVIYEDNDEDFVLLSEQ